MMEMFLPTRSSRENPQSVVKPSFTASTMPLASMVAHASVS